MKKGLILTFALILVAITSSSLYGQESTKELRKERRTEEQEVAYAKMETIIKSKSFVFIPNRIQSTIDPNLVGVSISSNYGVWVSPYEFRSYLPVFGSDPYSGLATLLRTMDFNTRSYQFSYEPGSNTIRATINVTDTWNATNYTFTFEAFIDNNYATLNISTAFTSSITFQGTIVSYGN